MSVSFQQSAVTSGTESRKKWLPFFQLFDTAVFIFH